MSENKTIDEIPPEVLEELTKETGAPNPRAAEAPPPMKQRQPTDPFDQIAQALNQLGREIQATQAAVMRAQVRTQVFEDRLLDLAVELKELKNRVFANEA